MGSNPPITAVPFSLAQPKLHIARYLDSLRPYVAEHAYRGANYFHRSRNGGDQLCEEDWNPDYNPPDPILTLSNFLQSHSSPYASTSQLTDDSGKGNNVFADALRPPRLRDNTKTVDHGRGKHHLGRAASAQRTSPYQIRSGLKSAVTAGGGGDYYIGSGLRNQPPPQTQPQHLPSPELGSHDRAFDSDAAAAAVAPLGVEYEAAHPNVLSTWKNKDALASTRRATPKRLPTLDLGRDQLNQDVVQAAVGRLTIARPGIFARGVTSQPIKVAGTPQQPTSPYQLDERLLIGLAISRAQQQARAPLQSQQPPLSHLPSANHRMGSSIPWPSSHPYQQQQAPHGTGALPLEDASLLEAMLPFYASCRGETQQQQQQQAPSALASFFPTDISNIVSPIDPTSSPFDVFHTLHSFTPQASEPRAVSADPPRWDISADALNWVRPVSAPPSKLAPTPPEAPAPAPLPTPTVEPDHQDVSTGFCDTSPGGVAGGVGEIPDWLQQPANAKPLVVDTAFTLRPNDFADFDLKQWSPFPDQSNNWILSPSSHPAPYTYGFSPHAPPDPTTSLLPTASGPSGSSPFPSFHDAYTPHDSPYDSMADVAGPAPTATSPAGIDYARYL